MRRSLFIPIPKKGNDQQCSNCHTIVLISHVSKVMLKRLQASLQHCMTRERPDVQAGFRKGRRTRDQIANMCWIIEKPREFQKNITFIDYTKALTVRIKENCGKFLEMGILDNRPVSWETSMEDRKQQLHRTWNNGPVHNWERSTSRMYTVTLLI